ncbi:glycosyltransferase family 4 protein [Halorussus salinisoli]|uniref:glycosyltransferase family 4 protein n=1 Tax=Halorussus salinisoli TaxID=2558242 RepID=UPI0010C24531|nr:glycosyltransferase family 4 protein [Halorussus salinisoli]
MPEVLSLVNVVSSTSIPVEIASAVNEYTPSAVTMGNLMQDPEVDIDPDVESMDLPIVFLDGGSNFDVRGYKRLWDHLRTNEYDVLHTHHNFSGSVARLLGRSLNIPVVNTEHNDLTHFTTAQRAANAATFGLPAVNVYNSQSTKASRGPIERRLSTADEVVYNGVDVDRIDASEGYPLPLDLPDETLVTNVGVMTPQKNQCVILEAVAELKRRDACDDVHFVLAGSGPLEDELRATATRLQVDDMVTFTGYLPEREQVYSLLHDSDVFVNPSVYEGFCVAAVEAMACELPIIASDIEVLREVVGEPGIFVPHDDTKVIASSIAETVSSLGTDETERRRKKGRRRAVNKFSLERTATAYHELYADLSR